MAVGMSRAMWYRPVPDRLETGGDVIAALTTFTDEHRRWGFWKSYQRLRLDGHRWNHKRVYRVYCQLGLNHKRRTKKRIPTRCRQPLDTAPVANTVWSLDFMHDALYVGRRFRTLNIMDDGVREVLAIEIDTSLTAERVIRVLERVTAWRGLPQAIRCDNGPELTSLTFMSWCAEHGVAIRYIQPGKPNQNAFIERFNRTYREEVLNSYLFENLDQVREITYRWRIAYNERRPHDALGGLPPTIFRQTKTAGVSTLQLST
jgi:putative transposase